MSKSPSRSSRVVPLLVAGTVLVLGFGGGVLGGWATRARRPPVTEKSAEEIPDAEVKKALAACKRELRARKKARAFPPAPEDAGQESAARFEALRKEVMECRVRETLTNAYVCGAIDDHSNLYLVLAHGTSCVGDSGVAEFIVQSLDKCAEFEDFPAHLDDVELTRGEKHRIYQSLPNRDYKTKEKLTAEIEHTRRECRRVWALPDE